MKVVGIDGRVYTWNLSGRIPLANDTRPRSNLHLSVRTVLQEMYKGYHILEEVALPGSGGLILDFYIPLRKSAIEAHGEEHFKYIPFFHVSKAGYVASRKRDAMKRQWCLNNNIVLVELPFMETPDEWRTKLRKEIG